MAEVFRGRRRTISSIIGIMITVTFVSGTFIAIDSSLRAISAEFLAGLQSDFVVTALTNRTSELAKDVRSVSGVTYAAPYGYLGLEEVGKWGEGPALDIDGLAVDPEYLPSVFAGVAVEGTMALPLGSAVISAPAASEIGAMVGDRIYLEGSVFNETAMMFETRFVNVTVEGIVRFSPDRQRPLFSANLPPERFVAVHLKDAVWYLDELFGRETPLVAVEVLVDRDTLLNPYDVAGSRLNLNRIEQGLHEVSSPYSADVRNLISIVLGNIEVASLLLRPLYLALSLPVITLGTYLGLVGVELGHADRRRELAILKTRGASPSQVWKILILESVIVGSSAALIGLIAGVGISRLVLGFVTLIVVTTPRLEDFAFNPTTVAATIGFGTLLSFAASHRSARRTARLPIVETLRYYTPGETKVEYRPRTDIILVVLGVTAYAVVLSGRAEPGGLVGLLAGPLFFTLLPIAPFLLLFGLTRLMTRSTSLVYEAVSHLLNPFAKNLGHIIIRNLARNPKRTSNVAVIIALGLAFSVFVLSLNQSLILREERIVQASIGADIAVVPPAGDSAFEQTASALPGVKSVTLVLGISHPQLAPVGFVEAFALDPTTYFATVMQEPWYFNDGDAEAARLVLTSPGQVLISKALMDDGLFEPGDTIRLQYSRFNRTAQQEETSELILSIGGVVRGLPGVPSFLDPPRAIYGSPSTLDPVLAAAAAGWNLEVSARLLVDLATDADWRATKEALAALGATEVRVFEEERATAISNPAARNALGFLAVQIVFVIAILAAGLALITYAASLEREVEFAAIMARGASGWHAATILLGESFSILVIGSLVGIGAGVVASFGGTQLFAAGPPGSDESLVPYPFVVPAEVALLVVLAFAVMLVASLFVSWRIARMDVARVLKLRGG